MTIFVTDLSTQPNRHRAARDGAIACFLLSLFALIGGWFSFLQGIWPVAAWCTAEAALGFVAGALLLRGRGEIIAGIAAAVMVVEIAAKLFVAGAAVAAFAELTMLAYTINAVRAVLAERAI
jgi:hypothetical protein